MSILHTLKAVKKAAPFTTHEQRVQVLSEVPPGAMESFLKARSETASTGWLDTLTVIGALDAGTFLDAADSKEEKQKKLEEWMRVAHFVMDFAGEPTTKKSPDGMGSPSARTYTVFEASEDMRDAFHRATERLVLQADALRKHGVKIPELDSMDAINSRFLGVLSRWAGTACMLDRPDTLKLLIDVWPEAMSCAIPVDTKTLRVAASNKDTQFDLSSDVKDRRTTPFYCALQVGSTACMDAIFDKRASLSLPMDVPISAVGKTPNSLGNSQARPFSHAMFHTDPVCSPQAYAHAVARIQPALDAQAQGFLATKMIDYGEKHPNHLASVVGKNYMFENDQDPNTDGKRMRLLTVAVLHAQTALPQLLENVPWDRLLECNRSPQSIVSQTMGACRKDLIQPRQDALLALIAQAKLIGREDAMFATYVSEREPGQKRLEPVTSLSANGINHVLVPFLDNGFHPDAKHAGVPFTLNQIADAEDHPTRNLLRSYVARKSAQRLIDEMDMDTAPAAVSP